MEGHLIVSKAEGGGGYKYRLFNCKQYWVHTLMPGLKKLPLGFGHVAQ